MTGILPEHLARVRSPIEFERMKGDGRFGNVFPSHFSLGEVMLKGKYGQHFWVHPNHADNPLYVPSVSFDALAKLGEKILPIEWQGVDKIYTLLPSPSRVREFQGRALTYNGELIVEYDTGISLQRSLGKVRRAGLLHEIKGVRAQLILSEMMPEDDYNELHARMLAWPSAIFEFTVWDSPVGIQPGYTCYWEVRWY